MAAGTGADEVVLEASDYRGARSTGTTSRAPPRRGGGFAAVYGNDWLRVPFRVSVGSVARVIALTVLDDYGERHEIPATATLDGPARTWRFFELGDDRTPLGPLPAKRSAPLLLLAPALPDAEAGPPIERVDLIQDGVANLAWGIERRARAASGRPVDRDAQAA